jgi:hypothetical protein
MPRTTLELDGAVLQQLRRRGEREGKSMGRVASELLAVALADAEPEAGRAAFAWKTGDLGTPRVDLEDKEALRRALGHDS